MTKTGASRLNVLARRIIYGVILTATTVAGAVAQPPAISFGPGGMPTPAGSPADFNPAREQPAPLGSRRPSRLLGQSP